MRFSTFAVLAACAVPCLAHGDISPELGKRYASLSKRCAAGAGEYKQKRMLKRHMSDLSKRAENSTFQITTEAPHYDSLQNNTCVLTPDVTAGPYYWPRSETLRQDMSENEPGVPLILDVGVIDMNTCEPLPNALVAFWHCNGTGSYSSFTGRSPNTPFEELLEELNITDSFEIGVTDLHTDDTTFLRGMWPSNDEGILEMKTTFPGFYVGRAIHIHVQVFTDWVLHTNGTVKTGDSNSIGQLYFNETVSETLMAEEPYSTHTQIERVTIDTDTIFSGSTEGGYNPIVDIVPLDGKDIRNGVIGYVTIGIDTTASPPLAGNESGAPPGNGTGNGNDTDAGDGNSGRRK